MTSYIKVQRICKQCGIEFTARTTATQYCGAVCSKRAYKARKRDAKITANDVEVRETKIKSRRLDEFKLDDREFLSVQQVAVLIGCSKQNIYYLINTGKLKATNLMQRKTIIRRCDLNALLDVSTEDYREPYPKDYPITECYNMAKPKRNMTYQVRRSMK